MSLVLGGLIALPAWSAGPAFEDASRDYSGRLAAFPGAQGFGSVTRAGRGGRVLRVTTLADSGPGSLRRALKASGPRTVIFEVGGVIHLRDDIVVSHPYLTVAGQTAPAPGITLAGDTLRIHTHDVVVRHLRIRVGDDRANSEPEFRDGLGISTDRRGSFDAYNVLIDHCSISWAIDENLSLWYANVYDVTVSNNIISEALSDSLHPDGSHSMGLLVGQKARRIGVVRNLLAHNTDRNPRFAEDTTGIVVNNLMYNVRHRALDVGGDGEPIWVSVIGNVYLPGRDARKSIPTVVVTNDHPETRVYVADNVGPYAKGDPWSVVDNRVGEWIRSERPPVTVSPLEVMRSGKTRSHVLKSAGARPRDRDAVDRRVVRSVRKRSGRIIDSPDEVGGLPPTDSTRRPLAPPPTDADTDGDGYTDLEEWLHCMAAKVEKRGAKGRCPGPFDGVAFD